MAFNPPPPPPHPLDSYAPYGDPFDERQQRPSYPPTMESSSNVHLPAPMNNPTFGASDLSIASKDYDQEAEHEALDAFDESRPLTHPTHAYPPQQFVYYLHSVMLSIFWANETNCLTFRQYRPECLWRFVFTGWLRIYRRCLGSAPNHSPWQDQEDQSHQWQFCKRLSCP